MKAIVMAGGFGTRIQPLTSSRPKPMLPILNKPMMEYIIHKLKEIGVVDIAILLYFKPDVIKNYFKDGKDFGVHIHYILPDGDFGTAGAVKKAEKFVNGEDFIVISGDLVTDFNLDEIIGFHNIKHSFCTICLTSVDDPLQFGVVITDKSGKILRFLEKPGWGEVFSDTVNTGIYVFKADVLKFIPNEKAFDFSKDLFPLLMERGIDLFGYTAEGYWRDVGNPQSYRDVLNDIIKGRVNISHGYKKFDLKNATVYSDSDIAVSKEIFSGTVFIAKNLECEPSSKIIDSCLGENVKIGENCIIENSIIWENVVIESHCKIKNAVICNDVIIGRNVHIPKGCIIAEHTEVGDNVIIEKDIMIWPNKLVEEGSILSSNLIWGDKWKKSIFEGGKVIGKSNIELSPEMAAKLGAAVGSCLPKDATVVLGRDYHNASRMIKRAFLGGILSAGINAYDLKLSTIPITKLYARKLNANMSIYFRQATNSYTDTEIIFSDEYGVDIDSAMEKNIERVFFRENFRRASPDTIGKLIDIFFMLEEYEKYIYDHIDTGLVKRKKFKIVADMFNGTGSNLIPKVLTDTDIEPVILNAYFDEKKLSRTLNSVEVSKDEVSKIIKTLNADLGFIIFQNAERLQVFTDKGEPLTSDQMVMSVIKLLSITSKNELKVYLPVMMPTVFDNEFENIKIVRGKSYGLKQSFIKDFDFIGWNNHLMAFPAYASCSDALFNALKIMELLAKAETTLGEVVDSIPKYFYTHNIINCPLNKKGLVMRRMSEEAVDKEASFVDGVKIYYKDKSWVLMIPDQFSPNLHLYVEASTEERRDALLDEYIQKINEWLS